MEVVVASVLGLLFGGVGIFFFKKFQDDAQKKSAKIEAERILNRAKSESAKIDKDSKNKAKDFETRARKNVEQEIQKQKSTLKTKEGSWSGGSKRSTISSRSRTTTR
jgi:ribonuclease Y